VEHLRSPAHPPHDLGKGGILEIAQALSGLVGPERREKQVPQPFGSGQRLEILHAGDREGAGRHLALPWSEPGAYVLLERTAYRAAQVCGQGTVGKIHGQLLKNEDTRSGKTAEFGPTMEPRTAVGFSLSCIRG